MSEPKPALEQEVRRRAEEHGLNLLGLVAAEEFDRCQPMGRRAQERLPACDTILLMGAGGSGFWDKMTESLGGSFRPRPRPGYHPIHDFSVLAAEQVCGLLEAAGHECAVVYPDDTPSLNFMQLAEMGGLGTVSPVIGLLLNPEFGPWVSLRAAILLRGSPFSGTFSATLAGGGKSDFEPCLTCPRPCVTACPAQVFDGQGGVDFQACGAHRHARGCAGGCEARRTCPVGAEHRFGPSEERFRHAYSYFTLRKTFGYGWRKILPPGWR